MPSNVIYTARNAVHKLLFYVKFVFCKFYLFDFWPPPPPQDSVRTNFLCKFSIALTDQNPGLCWHGGGVGGAEDKIPRRRDSDQ